MIYFLAKIVLLGLTCSCSAVGASTSGSNRFVGVSFTSLNAPPSKKRSGISAATSSSTPIIATTSSNLPILVPELVHRPKQLVTSTGWLTKTVCVGLSCWATWAITYYRKWSAVRSSSTIALLSCGICSPPLAAACLSGAFAGMSNHLQSSVQALTLSIVAGLIYAWESSFKSSILLGKGGRLGTISVLASLCYFALKLDQRSVNMLQDMLDRMGGPRVTTALALILAIIYQTNKLVPDKSKDRPSQFTRILMGGSKVALLAVLTSRWMATQHSKDINAWLLSLVQSAGVMFACSLLKFFSPGNVLPYSLLGLAASFVPKNPDVTMQMCVGGLMGMTNLKGFSVLQLLETSIWVTMLLQGVGGFAGLGGRLGAFTLLGVVLANLSWGITL